MAGHGAALVFDLVARGNAPGEFIRMAGAADKAATATGRMEKNLATASARMSTTGAKLSKSLTLPLLAVGAVGVVQAAKWQRSMTLIQTAGGETAAKATELSGGLKKLAVETGTSLDALGEGIYTIAKAGAGKWSASDQLLVMKAAAQGAKAENVSLGVATDALSTVMLDYHVAAGKAVSTENELIRASGLAKTNFSDFSSSLSNVTPIAAALGVSFAEVGGAIATMTQHGVSAQQATENLRNLLFNLSGQNNVASQAMQQLGLDTVDLTKNLGARGLSGTLAIVDRALAQHTKNGLVVVDVHKAAALATRSLNTMLGEMTGPLKTQATALLTGRESIKDYTVFAKSLGGEAGASALQFKALYLNSEGFSNQLRAGKGTLTTSTAQYAKLLGGMTGASVAMQIGGKYAKENARNVALVGKAALDAGADVLGWDKTQGTLAVKLDKAKASLQVMAVEIGDALIPAVSKLVGWVGKGVHWFEGLSGGTKKFIGVAALVAVALGPVLSVFGRLVAFQGRVQGALARTATVAASSATGVVASSDRQSGALTAQSVMAEKNAAVWAESEARKAQASAAAAGAVARSLEGVDTVLANDMRVTATNAEAFAVAMRARAEAAVASAKVVTAAYGEEMLAARGATAAGGGALVAGRGAGRGGFMRGGGGLALGFAGGLGLQYAGSKVGGRTGSGLSDAGTGVMLGSFLGPEGALIGGLLGGAYGATDKGPLFKKAVDKIVAPFKAAAAKAAEAKREARAFKKDYSDALTLFTDAELQSGHHKSGAARGVASQAVTDPKLAAAGQIFGLTQKDLTNAVSGSRDQFARVLGMLQSLGPAYDKQVRYLKALRHGYDDSSAAARQQAADTGRVLSQYDRTVSAAALLTGAQFRLGAATKNVSGTSQAFEKSLRAVGTAVAENGRTLDQDTLFGQRNAVAIQNAARASLRHAQAVAARTGSVEAGVKALQSDRDALIETASEAGLSAKAAGHLADEIFGIPRDYKAKITVNTDGAKATVRDLQTDMNNLLNLINDVTFGFAGLGSNHGTASVSHPRMVLELSNGAQTDRNTSANAPTGAGTNAAKKRGAGQISPADQQAAADRAASAKQATKQAAQDRASAFKSAYDSAVSTAQARLDGARQAYRGAKSAVRSAYTGTFDVASAGGNQFGEPVTFSAIKRQLDKAVANAKRFTAALRKLQHEGLGTYLLQQLADAGPAALPQALALLSATPKQIKALSYEYRTLGRYGDRAGGRIAEDMYGAGVRSAQGLVNGLLSKQSAVNAAVKQIGDGMVLTLRSVLDMHSPSRRLFNEGALAFEGYKQGIESMQKPVEKAAGGVAGASVPGRGTDLRVGGQAVHIENLVLQYPKPDTVDRGLATAMRAATTVLR